MQLLDGNGNGFLAAVDNEHRLAVKATMVPMERHVAHDEGESYIMDIDSIQTDGAGYWLAIIKNTANKDLVVTSLVGWVSSFKNDQIYEVYLGGTFTYATNGTAVVPANVNAGSGKTATGVFYVNDTSGNITTVVTGSVTGRIIFGTTPTIWAPVAGWILPKNQCWMLYSNLAEKLTGYISFYYHEAE